MLAIKTGRRFGFVSSGVVLGSCCAGSTVVAALARASPALVVWGRMLVSILVAADAELSCAVPASLPSDDESRTSAVPSARQNASVSSFSTRLHAGQRFIFWNEPPRSGGSPAFQGPGQNSVG